jgi:hypothetical protein
MVDACSRMPGDSSGRVGYELDPARLKRRIEL